MFKVDKWYDQNVIYCRHFEPNGAGNTRLSDKTPVDRVSTAKKQSTGEQTERLCHPAKRVPVSLPERVCADLPTKTKFNVMTFISKRDPMELLGVASWNRL